MKSAPLTGVSNDHAKILGHCYVSKARSDIP